MDLMMTTLLLRVPVTLVSYISNVVDFYERKHGRSSRVNCNNVHQKPNI